MASSINSTSAGNGGLVSTGDDSGILNIQTNETTAITVDASQRVGVGVTPSDWGVKVLQAGAGAVASGAGTASTGFTNNLYTSDAFSTYKYINNGYANMYYQDGNHRWFNVASGSSGATATISEVMRIDSSGNLNIASSASNGAYVNIWCGDNSRNGLNIQVFSNGNNAVGFKNVSGSQVGSITVNASTTAYNTSSDYRLKENIAPMTGALAKVALLKPVTYKWKLDGSNGEGFIAHELAEVKPDCVSGDKDAIDADGNPVYQGIDTSFLVATLTAALQETKALIDTQAETINALTARIVALEGK